MSCDVMCPRAAMLPTPFPIEFDVARLFLGRRARVAPCSLPEVRMTPRQRSVIDFISGYELRHRHPPSVREIAAALNLRSAGSMHACLTRMKQRGLIAGDRRAWRDLQVVCEGGASSLWGCVSCVR